MHRHSSSPRGRVALAIVAAAASVFLAACAGGSDIPVRTDEATAASPVPSREPQGARVRLVVAGDSNSTGFMGSLASGMSAGVAWMSLLPPDRFEFAGGWAGDGATSTVIAQNLQSVEGADFLVVMAGTNDIARGLDAESSLAEIEQMVATVGADRVVICAIAPFAPGPDRALAFNALLAQAAGQRGWAWVDPWEGLRAADGAWRTEYATDGVHTSASGYAVMASDLAQFLESASTTGPSAGPG